jgi:hypothetical protein
MRPSQPQFGTSTPVGLVLHRGPDRAASAGGVAPIRTYLYSTRDLMPVPDLTYPLSSGELRAYLAAPTTTD